MLALPGGYIGDRVQRKPLLFLFAVIGAPLSLIYLLPVPFAAVIILSVYVRAFEQTPLLFSASGFCQGWILLQDSPARIIKVIQP